MYASIGLAVCVGAASVEDWFRVSGKLVFRSVLFLPLLFVLCRLKVCVARVSERFVFRVPALALLFFRLASSY